MIRLFCGCPLDSGCDSRHESAYPLPVEDVRGRTVTDAELAERRRPVAFEPEWVRLAKARKLPAKVFSR